MTENANQATLPELEKFAEHKGYKKAKTVMSHDIDLECDDVTISRAYNSGVKVSLCNVNANELADVALEVCEADYLARNIVLLHLDEVKEALEELENEYKFRLF